MPLSDALRSVLWTPPSTGRCKTSWTDRGSGQRQIFWSSLSMQVQLVLLMARSPFYRKRRPEALGNEFLLLLSSAGDLGALGSSFPHCLSGHLDPSSPGNQSLPQLFDGKSFFFSVLSLLRFCVLAELQLVCMHFLKSCAKVIVYLP